MNTFRRASIVLVSALMGISLLGMASPANADTSWGRGGTVIVNR
ncbi:MAG: hypothetical protein U0R80_13765 [Nocardioidaceae bacterium]